MSNFVRIKLTGDNAERAFDGWAKKTGQRMNKKEYVKTEAGGARVKPVNLSVCFLHIDLDTFDTRLAKLKEATG